MASKDMAKYMRGRRAARRKELIKLKGERCARCGSAYELEFNHLDRSDKSFTLSGKGLDKSWDKILAELDKCELLCREHHLEYTRQQHKTGEIVPWNSKKDIPYEHGTTRTYMEIKCRCVDCVYARKLNRKKELSYSDVVVAPLTYKPWQR